MSTPGTAREGFVVRRTNTTTKARFTARKPSAEAEADTSQSIVGVPAPKSQRVTDRRREIAGDLPDWDLLPPGELAVRRK